MFVSLLKKAVPIPRIEKFGTFLFVGPHPDDIEVGAGATVAALTNAGKRVVFLIATNGCVGGVDPEISAAELVEIRKKEQLASAKMLGVIDVRFLPFDDGASYDKVELMQSIAKVIVDVQPDVIFCPDHKVCSECHPDHLYVGEMTTFAYFVAGWPKLAERHGIDGIAKPQAIAYYYTDKPNYYVKIKKTFELKMEAVGCHKSQFTKSDLKNFGTYFKMRAARFGLRSGKGKADGFRVLGNTHQHCFPEASEF